MDNCRVLFVDDDAVISQTIKTGLEKHIRRVDTVTTSAEALECLGRDTYDIVITELQIGTPGQAGSDGLSLIKQIKNMSPDTEVILQTGFGSIENAVTAMKAGALDYVEKPYKLEKLLLVMERAIENRKMRNEISSLRQQVAWDYSYDNIIGDSGALRQVKETVARLSDSELPILITGESGVGKELFAKAVHYHSRRRKMPFIPVNCGAIPQNLIESELFGLLKGSFTSANTTKRGLFEQADGGTILLDEIGEVPMDAQVKLLRVLEENEIMPVGATTPRKINVRVIATSNCDLSAMVSKGTFREDLYHRLSIVPLHIPSLRDRKEDIPALAEKFLRATRENDIEEPSRLTRGAFEKLLSHDWPGNIRELENTIRRAKSLSQGLEISADDIFFVSSAVSSRGGSIEPSKVDRGSLETTFRNRIVKSLQDNNWNFTQTAVELGIGRTTLWRKVKKYDLKRDFAHS